LITFHGTFTGGILVVRRSGGREWWGEVRSGEMVADRSNGRSSKQWQ
jgi:hypothetical protein